MFVPKVIAFLFKVTPVTAIGVNVIVLLPLDKTSTVPDCETYPSALTV